MLDIDSSSWLFYTKYSTYRFFENPYIHEHKPSLSACTLVCPILPWCAGEVWGCSSLRIKVKVKVMFTLEQATKAQKWS